MSRKTLLIAALALGTALASCQSTRPDRDWVQTNVVSKDIFQGEWLYARTVVDTDQEGSWLMAFRGDMSFSMESSIQFTIPRIRWVIDENYLYAFRADAIVTGADEDEPEPDFYTGMIAAFPVDAHLDIIRSYNPSTGERLNVVSEDENERPWYDREYMRVDWSQNLVTGFQWTYTEAMGVDGYLTRESTSFACNEGTDIPYTDDDNQGDIVCREEWLPQIRYTDPDGFDAVYGTYYARELREDACRNPVTGEVPELCDGSGLAYMFSFVNQEMWTPTIDALGYLGVYPFTALRVAVRNTFIRSPERSTYEPLNVPDATWDRFGPFRLERATYTGGEGEDPSDGIEPSRGLTDMIDYWAARHNMWVDYRNGSGEVIPPADRQMRHIGYYLTKDYPKWLVPVTFRQAEDWNNQFMRAYYLAQDRELPADGNGDTLPDFDCTVTRGDEAYRDNPANMPERFSAYDTLYDNPASIPRFVGADCVLVLRVNSADLPAGEYVDAIGTRTIVRDADGKIDPEQSNVEPYGELLGDFRFHFLNIVEEMDVPFGGISTLRADIRNGQLVSGNANVAIESVYYTMTRTLQWLGISASLCADDDIIDPAVCTYMQSLGLDSLDTILSGEDVRSYFSNLGQVERPFPLVTPGSLNAPSTEYNAMSYSSVISPMMVDRMSQAAEKVSMLTGPEADMRTYSDRVANLKDTRFESMLFDNPETLALLAGRPEHSGADLASIDTSAAEVLDEVSFFRTSPVEQAFLERKAIQRMASVGMDPMSPVINYEYTNLADRFEGYGWNPSQIAMWAGQAVTYNLMIHELGHSLGLRHNFAGSADYRNYHDCYWDIAEANPWPQPDAFDQNLILSYSALTFEETVEFSRAVDQVTDARQNAGIARCENASVMDYMLGYLTDVEELGNYDKAYIDFVYGGRVEAYVGDPRLMNAAGTSRLWENIDPRGFAKTYWVYYQGGETCETDADCPYAMGNHAFPADQQVMQRCVVNPRLTDTTLDPDLLPRVCSNFDDDFYQKISREWSPTGAPYFQVKYMFCSDERTGDISWCNMTDRGGSFREIIKNWRDLYDRAYPFSWFRRHRRVYGGASFWGYMTDMVKIYQHFFYRWFYEPGYSELKGPLYFEDQFLASVDALNFFQSIIATPDVGSYDIDPVTGNYYKVSNDLGAGDLDVPVGMGKYMWSAYQDGPMGVYEMERMGLHWDKIYALLAMAVRDWNLMYSYDERFTINFYSLFDWEIMRLFGGVILDDPSWYGAHWYTDTSTSESFVYYPQIWAGMCSLYLADCPTEYYYDYLDGVPAFEDGSNEIIRNFAAIFSLAEFPIFYDTTYEQQLFICERGSGYCFDICEEGDTAYFCDDPGDTLTRDEDYVLYTSDRLHKTYQAVSYESITPYPYDTTPDVDISLELLRRASALQDALRTLEAHEAAGTCPPEMTVPCDEELDQAIARTSYTLSQHESFLVNLIDIQREYGITSWL